MTTSKTKADIAHGMAETAISFAKAETGIDMDLKTLTCDYLDGGVGHVRYEAEMVRRTRSLIFININAVVDGTRVATGAAILSISDGV